MLESPATDSQPYYLGCPVWACSEWVGDLYRSPDRKSWLRDYSAVYNTVEGNSTFYGLPSLETVCRWAESTADGFRFALKFPREISHEKKLVNAERSTEQFLEILQTLDRSDRLGPSFLQLPPYFAGTDFDHLRKYLEQLPREFPWAVEVRHDDYFVNRQTETELNSLLTELGIDRCLFDSRALFSRDPGDDIERESQRRKPRSPVRSTVTGQRPMLRFVGRNNIEEAQPWIEEWGPIVAGWIESGLEPFVFTHSPNDAFAPQFARRMHNQIRIHTRLVPALNAWPGAVQRAKQRTLF